MIIEKPFRFRSVSVPLWFSISLMLSAYTVWEVYWFGQVGLNCIKWHAHLMVFVYLWLAGFVVFKLSSHPGAENFFLSFTSLIAVLFFLELGLMFTGFNKTYVEKRSGHYQSVFNFKSSDSLWHHKPLKFYRLKTPEYDYPRQSNSLGFGDEEWIRDSSKILIQTYGDSFTEGDGAPADSSFPAILRTMLGKDFMVQNYGVCGNDPGFYVPQFGKVGAGFKPDVMVLSYGTGDFIHDLLSRGGLERFSESGWQTRQGAWWEAIYAVSYLSRIFFHAFGIEYNLLFIAQHQMAGELKKMESKWNEIFVEIADLAMQHQTRILLVKRPEHREIDLNKYDCDMIFFDSLIATLPVFYHVDLLSQYRSVMKLDSGETTAGYYWQKDRHHNSTGYHVMARMIKDNIEDSNLLLPKEKMEP